MLLFVTSCKYDHYDEVIKTSRHKKIDMVYHAVIKSFFKDNRIHGITVMDRAHPTDKTDTMYNHDYDSVYYWNKKMFPYIIYANEDSTYVRERYWKYRKKLNGWTEISIPEFSKNKQKATVIVWNYSGETFGQTTLYYLELINGEYQIVKTKMLTIS